MPDYLDNEAIARLIKKRDPSHKDMVMVKAIAEDFAELFKEDNPEFDRALFLVECGLGIDATLTHLDAHPREEPA